jgi:hypothetical protein
MRSPIAVPCWLTGITVLGIAGCGSVPSGTEGSGTEDITPQVTSAEPAAAYPGQRLSVRVKGSGFDQSAQASWELNGAIETRILVHSTTYVSASELIADITVGNETPQAVFSVGVRVARKKGSGIEKGVRDEAFLVGRTVSLSGGFVSTTPQPVYTWFNDEVQPGPRNHQYWHSEIADFIGTSNFANTHAAGIGQCWAFPYSTSEETRATLFERLTEAASTNGLFYAHVDLVNLDRSWGDNMVMRNFRLGDSVQYAWSVGGTLAMITSWTGSAVNYSEATLPYVRKLGADVYEFSGGSVFMVQGPWRAGVIIPTAVLICPNLDTVVMTYPASQGGTIAH